MNQPQPYASEVDPEAAEALLDMLLLAIIRANPVPTAKRSDDHLRLNDAKKSLFGIATPRGRNFGNDLPELVYMARQYIAERGRPEIGPEYELSWPTEPENTASSVTALANEALEIRKKSEPDFPMAGLEERVHRLQKKFEKYKQPVLKMVYGRDGLAETVFSQHLREVKGLLEHLGIKVEEPTTPLRDPKHPI